jgi:membrane-bound lytic murein transglycosylase D
MPAEVAILPMIESDYNPFGYSNRGATGLWQLMPGTASGFGLAINWWYDGRRDVVASTNAALNELQYLHDYFHNWLLAFAAYDCGQGAVINAIHYNKRHGRPTDFWSLPLPEETKIYVPKLLALAQIIQHPKTYGVKLMPVANAPYFTTIKMQHQVSLEHVAALAGSSTQLIQHLNPGFRRADTMPHHQYNLLVPLNKADTFREKLAMKTDDPLSYHLALNDKWTYHRVRAGDSLRMLAARYNTTTNEIRRMNKLDSDTAIRIGENILIPEAQADTLPPHSSKAVSEDGLPGPKRIYHIMQRHETLSQVARHYHVSADDIWFWNEFTDNTKIHPGMKIALWVSTHHATHHRRRHHHSQQHYAYHHRYRYAYHHRYHRFS